MRLKKWLCSRHGQVIKTIRSTFENDSYRKRLSQFKGGAFYIFAGYLMDVILLMLGAPGKVTSFLQRTRDDSLIDNGLAVLEYPRAAAPVRVSVEEVDGMAYRSSKKLVE